MNNLKFNQKKVKNVSRFEIMLMLLISMFLFLFIFFLTLFTCNEVESENWEDGFCVVVLHFFLFLSTALLIMMHPQTP